MIVPLLSCEKDSDEDVGEYACAAEVSLSDDIMPIIESDCSTSLCHLDGTIPLLNSKEAVLENIDEVWNQINTFQMPPASRTPLESKKIDLIKCWVNEGKKDN